MAAAVVLQISQTGASQIPAGIRQTIDPQWRGAAIPTRSASEGHAALGQASSQCPRNSGYFRAKLLVEPSPVRRIDGTISDGQSLS